MYIYFRTFKIQPSKVWIRLCKLCKWTQKLRDKIVSNETKTVGAKNTFKHYALNISYCLWILYDLGSAIWLGDTLQSPNRVLAERRRVDSYNSCNRLTIETSKRLEWKAMHFVAFRKLNSDTSATISELPFSLLSLWVKKKIIEDDDWDTLTSNCTDN